ncbi:HAD domain-containing protein [Nocardia zapadnayensis]|uniref:HAD domain-containing protein n=1 Tax=uncultured Brevibacterium sp. TaxID=189678 RepID=UPI0022468CB0|nr:HAD domain-containing protein [Nocardia zapadnayensis]MCX0277940.1 HAD domain-containing protein [Nocardia zapadnayensis]
MHVYLDIDGVLVTEPSPPFPRDFTARDVRVADGRFVPVAYSASIIAGLAEILGAPGVSVTTVSSWEHDAPYLFRALGLPECPWLEVMGHGPTIFHGKERALLTDLAAQAQRSGQPPGRVLWIDDHLPPAEADRAALAASLPAADALLIRTSARECLTAAHLGEIAEFVHR